MSESSSPSPQISEVVARLARAIQHALDPGEVAALRRLDPESPSSAFWKVAATHLESTGQLRDGPGRQAHEVRWAVILRGLALMEGLHSPAIRLGRALAEAGYSEVRLNRLLRARDGALHDEATSAVRYLAAKAQEADLTEFALLLVSQEEEPSDAIRRRIARDYFSSSLVR